MSSILPGCRKSLLLDQNDVKQNMKTSEYQTIGNQTCFGHLNTRQVRYSNPRCILQGYLIEKHSTRGTPRPGIKDSLF